MKLKKYLFGGNNPAQKVDTRCAGCCFADSRKVKCLMADKVSTDDDCNTSKKLKIGVAVIN